MRCKKLQKPFLEVSYRKTSQTSELANFDVILTVAIHAPIKTVLEVKQAFAEQGYSVKWCSSEWKRTKNRKGPEAHA